MSPLGYDGVTLVGRAIFLYKRQKKKLTAQLNGKFNDARSADENIMQNITIHPLF
jgi:hypothetical protein